MTVPNGVWRIIRRAYSYWAAGAVYEQDRIWVRRGGVDHAIGWGHNEIASNAYKNSGWLDTPIILIPGDAIYLQDVSAGNCTRNITIGYIDVPIPPHAPRERAFLPGKRG